MEMQSGAALLVKRVFDRTVGAGLLAATSPLIVLAACAARLSLGKPALYSQVRPGFRGKPFRIYKIRSMTDAVDATGSPLPDAERLTPLGKFLRETSLDELPQLWNVVRGDLSLVGPRPLLTEYLGRYSRDQARRHDVLPGITGWAQIHGRNAQTWEERFALDLWYVDHWSLWLDCKILCATFIPVIGRRGVSHGAHVTMPPFTGGVAHAVEQS